MNPYFLAILILLTGETALDDGADFLNIRNSDPKLPEEFQGVYDSQKYQTSLSYQLEGTRFEIFRRTFSQAVTIVFWLVGGFALVDEVARVLGLGEIATGLVFTAILLCLKALLQLPFSIYDTFVIEKKYGFNKTRPGTFIGDLVKGLLISVVLGAPILAGIFYFFEKLGPHAWVYAWIAFTLVQLLLTFLAPAILMPLFNRFSPLPEGKLKGEIEDYARSQEFKLGGIFTMDSSKRSTKTNAFFTGFGKFRRLVLFDTLIEKQTPEELVAIVAHEIGHFKERHILKSIGLSVVSTAAMFYAFSLLLDNRELFAAFGMKKLSVYASLIFIAFLFSPVFRFLSILTHGLSRRFEFEADAYSARTYGKAEALVSALKKLTMDNLSNLRPHPLKVALDYTHPPVLERIRVLRFLQPKT